MKDFSYLKPKPQNERMLQDGKKIFKMQLKGLEGRDIIINDSRPARGIVLNHLNDTSTSKEDRGLNTEKDTSIKKGDYVTFDNEIYIVLSDIDDHYAYNSCVIRKCTQTIYLPNDISIPSIVEGESYGVKIISNTDFINSVDTKVKVTIPSNEITRKHVFQNIRFCFENSEHGIFKVGDITVYNKGLMILTCQKDKYLKGLDNLETGIMFQGEDNTNPQPPSPTDYKINGEGTIKINKEYTYTVTPQEGNISFELDEYAVSENLVEMNISDYSCTLKALVGNELITLSAVKDGQVVASIDIDTVRY